MTDGSASVRLVVNGAEHVLPAEPDRSLLSVLRDELGLTGAKPGCGEGACGACTVLVDDDPVHSCRAPLSEIAGRPVRTVESLAVEGALHPVQQAFLDAGAFQCGYCTAGMIMTTVALIEAEPDPSDAAILAALHPNVCRCCTYPRILRAARGAAEMARATAGRRIEAGRTPDRTEPPGDERGRDGGRGAGSGPGRLADAGADIRASDTWRPERPWDMTPAEDRDWFGVLPDGLVAVREPDRSDGSWTTSFGAWIHVDGGGGVTAFTGKVDMGQDNRTALSLLVADELRVRLDRVRLVMGDTDLCPHDMGTFGSRSMVDAGSLLRTAAAGARRILLELAAERLGTEATSLEAADGEARSPSGSSASYGELVRGKRLVRHVRPERADSAPAGAAGAPGSLAAPGSPRAAGSPAAAGSPGAAGSPASRPTARDVVTGRRRYPSDLSLPGMLHGRVLRPPVAGATLRSVETSAAEKAEGASVVRDGSFVGVVARDPFAAGRALRAIAAEWEPPDVPPASGIEAWLRDHPAADDEGDGWEGAFHRESGDVDRALAELPVRLEATYTTAYIAHVPLETHTALATWEGDRLTVWAGTQVPFGVREELAEALGILERQVRVIVPDTGGGFGGKHGGDVAVEAARLARAAGRPVKVRWTRAEEFTAGYLRPAAVIDVRSGSAAETIDAWEMRNTNSGMFGLVGPYEIANERLDYQPADSPLPQGSYRALAATANHFARESHMDEIAAALGVDPLGLRLTHLGDERLVAALQVAAERIDWRRSPGPGEGVGIACGVEKGARVASAVRVRIDEDRRLTVERVVTVFDCGTIVNRDGLQNQVEGATVMGLGGALFEAIRFEDGAITNGSMTDYRVPRIDDVPPIEVVLIDRPGIAPAGGGETPIVAIAPALANAIFAATGVRLRSLPLVPDGPVPRSVE